MLIDKKGREVKFESLSKNPRIRTQQLSELREVFPIRHKHLDFFRLQTRARLHA